ncbi:hypothetical protein BLOT_016645 [Blomia tropicalis]|nr:hypothetical protein BLOT_016645 [Blomia tropicalis]
MNIQHQTIQRVMDKDGGKNQYIGQVSDENCTEYPEHHIENELNEIEQMKSDENDIKLDQNTIDTLEKMKDLNVRDHNTKIII